MNLSIGFSPCPNDTFIFDRMINDGDDDLSWDVHLEDVETLNQWALEEKLDVTKLSFATYLLVKDQYELLSSGAALGKGVGPILVSKHQIDTSSFIEIERFVRNAKIAIPGIHTTANLLLNAAFSMEKKTTDVLFSEIEDLVLDGTFDAGLLIHESRFTYQEKGLHLFLDLGTWWEQEMKAAIPLGGIVIRRDLAADWKSVIEKKIQCSLQYSWDRYPELSEFVTSNAQEMEPSVMRAHIELYVNEETMSLSDQGFQAINTLEKAYQNS